MRAPRLLSLAAGVAAVLALAKAERMIAGAPGRDGGAEQALMPPPAPPLPNPRSPNPGSPGPLAALAQAPPPAAPAAPTPPAPQAATEAAAERAVLEALRARRAEIEAREQATAGREVMLAAAERRLTQRVEELTALQGRLETLERERAAREEVGLRGLVRLYEGMRPRDAATIFDELEMPVLLPIVDRMREAKAAPVMAAMRPERARTLTAELARLRAERVERR